MPAVDPFAGWLLSLVGLSLPLPIETQAMLVSVLGLYVLFSLLLVLLLLLYGVGACCEGCFGCCQPRMESANGFLVLDEKTDMEAVAFQALAKAELIDGTPRLRTPDPYDRMSPVLPYMPQQHPLASPYGTPPPGPAGVAPASGRRSGGARGKQLPETQPAAASAPTGAPTASSPDDSPTGGGAKAAPLGAPRSSPFAPSNAGAIMARPASPGPQTSSRRGTPRLWSPGGKHDKECPSWYGV